MQNCSSCLLGEQVKAREKQVKKLKREVRRVRQESETAANEMQPQLRRLVDTLKAAKVRARADGGEGGGEGGGDGAERDLERGRSRTGVSSVSSVSRPAFYL